jgi:phosphonate ABC transporter permease subunit PhnE
MKDSTSTSSPLLKSLRTFILVILAVVVYAYAIEGSRINLQTPMQPNRQNNLINVLRLLAQPDFFVHDADTGQITGLSEASKVTLERIVETVFMALMASTIGTIIAIPISFIAARNLMEQVKMPLAGLTTALIALPIGGALVGWGSSSLMSWGEQIAEWGWLGVLAAAVATAAGWAIIQFGPALVTTERPTTTQSIIAVIRVLATIILVFLGLAIFAHFGLLAGKWLEQQLGAFGFIGNFIFILSDFFRLTSPGFAALLGALIATSLGSRFGQEAVLGLPALPARLFTVVVSAVGTAVLIYGIGYTLNWLYQFDNPLNWTTYPALLAGGAVGVVGAIIDPRRPFAVGFAVYTLFRTFLNLIRSIESLIMAIVFVIWVGVGPFAGVLALTLHSIAALGKLFSEQVESIAAGPIEGVTATGANRLQTIVYAVIPQIVPPYIAFAFYRWDINVRMSTIIGFVGGGGIGFVLSQNINLLRYQQASVMMIAIAIVVATLDFFSSKVRSRIL